MEDFLGSCAWLVLEAILSCGLDASLLLSEQERDIRLFINKLFTTFKLIKVEACVKNF